MPPGQESIGAEESDADGDNQPGEGRLHPEDHREDRGDHIPDQAGLCSRLEKLSILLEYK